MPASRTLRDITGMGYTPASIGTSALVLIDCQNTYREGVMQLEGVEPALIECRRLLQRYRDAGRPVIHIQHDAGAGTPYDVHDRIGAIADVVAPRAGEPIVVKNYPSSFEKTNLKDLLKGYGVEDITLAGFMTHVCVNSTARARFQQRLSRDGGRQCHGDTIASQSIGRRSFGQRPARRELGGAERYFCGCGACGG